MHNNYNARAMPTENAPNIVDAEEYRFCEIEDQTSVHLLSRYYALRNFVKELEIVELL